MVANLKELAVTEREVNDSNHASNATGPSPTAPAPARLPAVNVTPPSYEGGPSPLLVALADNYFSDSKEREVGNSPSPTEYFNGTD